MLLPICLIVLAAEPWPFRNVDFAERDAQAVPARWQHGSHDGGDYTFSALTEDGVSFARISGAAPSGRAFWAQTVGPLPCPPAFKISFKYRGTATQMDGFVRLRDGQDTNVELSKHDWRQAPITNEWTDFEKTFAVPKAAREAANGVRPELIVYARGVGTVDYSSFRLEPLDSFTPDWPTVEQPLQMPYRPADKQVCQQNPPDFSWPPVEGCDGYELQVSRSPDFAQAAHAAQPAFNFWNFDATFEPGVWYWRVRGVVGEDRTKWSPARRFRIDPDAWAFPVPTVDELLNQVARVHPRIWTTPATLAEFRERADGPRKDWFAALERGVRGSLATPMPDEPAFPFKTSDPKTAEWIAAHNKLRGEGEGAANRLQRTAFAYLVTGDEAIGRNAVEQLMNLAGWAPDGATGYATHDQVHRAIAYRSAMAYDWVSDLLTPEQRRTALAMIESRTQTMYQHLAVGRPLRDQPYESHGWTAYGYIGIIALATLHDLPAAEVWFRDVVPTYLNLCPPWGEEDGGWLQGVAYWQYSQLSNKEFYDALLSAVGLSLYDKAWSRNNLYFPLYWFPAGSPRCHFGDGNRDRPGIYEVQHYRRMAQMFQNPIAQWAWQQIGDLSDGSLQAYYRGDESLPARPPVEMPPSRWSKDIGWVAMHSDLLDPERVSLYFKSSWIGSFNHSHADQNQFVLNAFGEALAIDSGYYDWYASPHDKGYTRHTLAHNAITIDGGHGQPIFDATASGRILGMVSTPAIDIAGGDATAAYQGKLAKAVRRIVYLRPNTFVMIDDLAAPQGEQRQFEWWLHGLSPIAIDADQAGATVSQGKAHLKVELVAPSGLTASERDQFVGPPESYAAGAQPTAIRPEGRGDAWPDQHHVWFTTPKSAATRIVTTMQAYRDGEQPEAIQATRQGDTLLLTSKAGMVAVALSGGVKLDTLASDATVVATGSGAVAMADGTWLEANGQRIVASDRPISIAFQRELISVASLDDAVVRLRVRPPGDTTNPEGKVWDERGRLVGPERAKVEDGQLILHLEPGQWTLRMRQPQTNEATVTLPVSADGGGPVKLTSRTRFDGGTAAWGELHNEAGLYEVTNCPPALSLGTSETVTWLREAQPILLQGEPGPLDLKRLDQGAAITAAATPADDAMRIGAAVWWEAEAFSGHAGGNPSRYSHRTFLSGGVGVGEWTVPGMWLSWRVNVPKAGTYDVMLKAATNTSAKRLIQLGDQLILAELPASLGFGAEPKEWNVYRVKLGAKLPAGPATLKSWCADGLLNLDWLALL